MADTGEPVILREPTQNAVVPTARVPIHESDRTRVYREPLADAVGHVIRKEHIGPAAGERLRNERGVLAQLSGVAGVVQLAPVPSQPGALLIEDVAGVPLATAVANGPVEIETALRIAVHLAVTVSQMHRRGVVHRDISPANIIVSADSDQIRLIDFDLAATFAIEMPAFAHHSQIVGTLAYMAPEQTGRTARQLDHRADLYTLGAVLYELTTGRTPFRTASPLQLIHDHLATTPTPPADRNPTIPPMLSQIIMRLLEKEPDRRYQSAHGLAHDLRRVRDAGPSRATLVFDLGERDFPLKLNPSSRPVGREPEIAALGDALEEMLAGGRRTLLVSGAAGVGKTLLVQQLRPMTTSAGGWFVSGKFDQYAQDHSLDAVQHAFGRLLRLLLAEPEDRIAPIRRRLRDQLGENAGLAVSMLPELALLLDETPDTADHDLVSLQARLQHARVGILRAIASAERPVVMVIDDLQWAPPTLLRFLDAVQSADDLRGVLIVGAYRQCDVDATHPLTALMSRWDRLGGAPHHLHLTDLPPAALNTMLSEMLRLPPEESMPLAEAVGKKTHGNPYDTVELVNALRHDGALALGEHGWQWGEEAIRRYIGHGNVVNLLTTRVYDLPPDSVELLDVMSCLGGEITLERLVVALGLDLDEIDRRLGPALEDELVVLDQQSATISFRHDRVQQAIASRPGPQGRAETYLSVARRLAAHPEYEAQAAEPYLHALDAVQEPAERDRVSTILRAAAARARTIANYVQMERLVSAALDLAQRSCAPDEPATPEHQALVTQLTIDRHAALDGLGRFTEADVVYRQIRELTDDPLQLAEPTGIQISSLTGQNKPGEALELAKDLLRRLGVPVPEDPDQLQTEIAAGLEDLSRLAATGSETEDLARPEYDDPRILAVAATLDRALPPAFFTGSPLFAWMVTQSGRLWAEHGPCAALCGPLGHASFVTTAAGDYHTGVTIARRVVSVGEARGYEPNVSRARFTYSASASPWFEPIETTVLHSRQAHDGLVLHGQLYFAGGTYYSSVPELFDCALTLGEILDETDRALAFCARTGNDQAGEAYAAYRQLARALLGETTPGTFTDPTFDEAEYAAATQVNLVAGAYYGVAKALYSVLFEDMDAVIEHTAAVAPLMPVIHGTYVMAQAHTLQALALIQQVRTAPPEARAALLGELDVLRDWLSARADQVPENYRHLVHLIDAERAWATDNLVTAAREFDAAHREVLGRRRPWHQALILERAARFYLEQGLDQVGYLLLGEARQTYLDWGATSKVTELDRLHPTLGRMVIRSRNGVAAESDESSGWSNGIAGAEIDLIAIIKATRELGSETDVDRLRTSVTTILTALSGATRIQMLLWSDEAQGWFLSSSTPDGEMTASLDEAADSGLVPLSAFRYAERTQEPLVVEDCVLDDRFAQDPYFDGLACCSLMVVPIFTRGTPKAVLILENRASRAAFSSSRLDGIMLIAGQLALSLDSAMLTDSLERKVTERTKALGEVNEELSKLSSTDPLTGLANRRGLTEAVETVWRDALASGQPIALAIIDVDNFKEFNDRYGHPTGDRCLHDVAAAISQSVRSNDLVARYGGDEFVALLPGTDISAARAVAQRVRDAVRALDRPHEDSSHAVVTVSIGVSAIVPSRIDTPEQLIEVADTRLYDAKHSGRNRIASA